MREAVAGPSGWSAANRLAEYLAAMRERNVEVVRRGYEAFGRGDLGAAMELFHPDVEWHDPERPGGGTYRGHGGVLRNLAEWLEGWEEFRLEPEEFLAQVFRLREGKVVWARTYTSREEALKAAGLGEQGRTSPV
jgi:hypothetical protein